MRQTGRTSRIADFVVDQLYHYGRCIATDHIAYEYSSSLKATNIKHFIELVEQRINLHSRGTKLVESSVCKLNGLTVVDFTLTNKTQIK